MDAERVKKDKGIILHTEYDLKETNVPEGHYSAVFTSRILDCKVDVMAQFATYRQNRTAVRAGYRRQEHL